VLVLDKPLQLRLVLVEMEEQQIPILQAKEAAVLVHHLVILGAALAPVFLRQHLEVLEAQVVNHLVVAVAVLAEIGIKQEQQVTLLPHIVFH
jgi:hypothetical protein